MELLVAVWAAGSPEEKEEDDGKKKPGGSKAPAGKAPAAASKKPGAKGKGGAGEEVPVGDKGTLVLAAALPACTALRALDISGERKQSGRPWAVAQPVCWALCPCDVDVSTCTPRPTSVVLTFPPPPPPVNTIDPIGATTLATALARCTQLQELTLDRMCGAHPAA